MATPEQIFLVATMKEMGNRQRNNLLSSCTLKR